MKARYTRKKMMAWAMDIQEYNIGNIIHIPGETNGLADGLSRLPLSEFLKEPLEDEHFGDSERYPTTKKPTGEEKIVKEPEQDYIVNAHGVWKPITTTTTKMQKLVQEQLKDSFISKIFKFFSNQLDSDDTDFKKISNMSQNFAIIDGAAYFLYKQRGKPLIRRLCIPNTIKHELLEEIHEKGGHQGVNRTFEHLIERFWWENMFNDVCEHLKSCEHCKLNKLSANRFHSNNKDHIVVTERWHTVAIDWLYI